MTPLYQVATDNSVRTFEPWRCAKAARARLFVDEVIVAVVTHERANGLRQRARKAKDLATFTATIEAVVCDLAHLHLSTSPNAPACITVARRKADLEGAPLRYRAPGLNGQLPQVLDLLEGAGFIVQQLGDRSRFALVFTDEFGEMRQRRRTTIAPSPRLKAAIGQHGLTFADLGRHQGGEVVILKEERFDYWHTPGGLDYVENSKTERLRSEVEQINAWLLGADLTLNERYAGELRYIDLSDRRLRRIFTGGSFKSGGRLSGGFWMPLERTLRLTRLRISGEPVASLDYCSLNPRLVYAMEGIEPPQADSYAIPGLEEHRPGAKRLFNARLFDVGARKRKPRRTPEEVRAGTELFPPDMRSEDLIAALETAHRPIAHHFGTGIGHELQFIESTILVKVLLTLIGERVVALPVHDCVVVPRSKVGVARRVMEVVSREVSGSIVPVSVELLDN
jgi:hypothetical protein